MRRKGLVLVLVVVFMAMAGAAFALEMSGTVTAVDSAKSMFTIKGEKVEAGFDCEIGSLIKDVKVGDKVTVQYTEVGGKKRATKIAPMQQKKVNVGC